MTAKAPAKRRFSEGGFAESITAGARLGAALRNGFDSSRTRKKVVTEKPAREPPAEMDGAYAKGGRVGRKGKC